MHRRERERHTNKKEDYLFWGFILYILYRGFFVGFLPLEGFLGQILCLSCDFVFFSDYAYVVVVNLD